MHRDQPRIWSEHVGEYREAVQLRHRFDCSRPQLKRSVERQRTHMPIDPVYPGAHELEERVTAARGLFSVARCGGARASPAG